MEQSRSKQEQNRALLKDNKPPTRQIAKVKTTRDLYFDKGDLKNYKRSFVLSKDYSETTKEEAWYFSTQWRKVLNRRFCNKIVDAIVPSDKASQVTGVQKFRNDIVTLIICTDGTSKSDKKALSDKFYQHK